MEPKLLKREPLTLKVDQPVEIDLHGNPTTGYDWFLLHKPDSMLLATATYNTDSHLPGMVWYGMSRW